MIAISVTTWTDPVGAIASSAPECLAPGEDNWNRGITHLTGVRG